MNNQYNNQYNNGYQQGYQGYGYQGYGYRQNSYYQRPQEPLKGQAIASMVLGIIALVNVSTVIIGLVCGIISLCLASASKKNNNGTVLGMATAGKVCSIIAIILSLLMIVFYIFYVLFLINLLQYGYDGSNFYDFYYTAMSFIR